MTGLLNSSSLRTYTEERRDHGTMWLFLCKKAIIVVKSVPANYLILVTVFKACTTVSLRVK